MCNTGCDHIKHSVAQFSHLQNKDDGNSTYFLGLLYGLKHLAQFSLNVISETKVGRKWNWTSGRTVAVWNSGSISDSTMLYFHSYYRLNFSLPVVRRKNFLSIAQMLYISPLRKMDSVFVSALNPGEEIVIDSIEVQSAAARINRVTEQTNSF